MSVLSVIFLQFVIFHWKFILFLDLKRPIVRRTWSTPEKAAAKRHMRRFVDNRKLPSVKQCESIVKTDIALKTRTALQLRLWVNNQIRKQSSTGVYAFFVDWKDNTVNTPWFFLLEIRIRKTWTNPEKHIARKLFAPEIATGRVPTVQKCQDLLSKHSEFVGRNIAHIKSWVQAESIRQKR